MRSPRRGEVWVHVDRLDREDGRVMAVQWRGPKGGPYYMTAHRVEFLKIPRMWTKFFGRRSTVQPRLVVVIPGAAVTMVDLAPNLRVAQIAIASPTTSSAVDRRKQAHV